MTCHRNLTRLHQLVYIKLVSLYVILLQVMEPIDNGRRELTVLWLEESCEPVGPETATGPGVEAG